MDSENKSNFSTDGLGKTRNIYGYYLAEFLVHNGFFSDLQRIVKNPREGYEKAYIYVFKDSQYIDEAISFYKANLGNQNSTISDC